MMRFIKCIVDEEACRDCNFCTTTNICYSPRECTGCMSCYWACPYEARKVIYLEEERPKVRIKVDGTEYEVPKGITVLRALELIGYKITQFPGKSIISAPCRTGGCWSCAVLINGELERSCVTPVRDGMDIRTNVDERDPLRIVHGPEPHSVGGKATPWYEKGRKYVEVAIWVAGCNLRCPQCQNYHVTYDNASVPMTPLETAKILTYYRRYFNVKGIAISGGEPTINRRWLIEYFKLLRKMNKEKDIRLHLDSNGTVLKPDYIDELVDAGCNNIGVEPKGARVETFMKITGIRDRELAREYLKTSWDAIKYICDKYMDDVYLGVGIPYNQAFMTLEEVEEIGDRIASIDNSIQVCVLDYFPTFRRRDLKRPSPLQMLRVKRILNEVGLKFVIVQTSLGHIGP